MLKLQNFSKKILLNLYYNDRAYVATEEGDTGSNHYASLIYNDDFEQGSIQWKLLFYKSAISEQLLLTLFLKGTAKKKSSQF